MRTHPRRRKLLLWALVVVSTFTLLVLRSHAAAPKTPSDAAMRTGKLLRAEQLPPPFEALKKSAAPLEEPGPDDWLSEHVEPGQTAASYKNGKPVKAEEKRRTIVLQPIGPLSADEQQLVADTAEFLGLFYGLPVRIDEPLALSVIPDTARRENQYTHEPQVRTTYILQSVLKPRVTNDVLAVIGLTGEDLYPDPAWNFVFGEASLEDRVGVWSFHRFGDLKTERAQVLDRTLKTAVHEFGHMLGMQHCVAYACVMNGSNHLDESDSRPLEPCPICLHKLTWNTGVSPQKRYEDVIAFYEKHGLKQAAAEAKQRLAVINSK